MSGRLASFILSGKVEIIYGGIIVASTLGGAFHGGYQDDGDSFSVVVGGFGGLLVGVSAPLTFPILASGYIGSKLKTRLKARKNNSPNY